MKVYKDLAGAKFLQISNFGVVPLYAEEVAFFLFPISEIYYRRMFIGRVKRLFNLCAFLCR